MKGEVGGRTVSARGRAAVPRPSKGGGGCRRAAAASSSRPMLPTPLAPLDASKTRALTTIYAPRKLKPRKNKTAQTRMLENDIQIKPTLSPFHPLPAIGQKLERSNTKVILFDFNKESDPVRYHEVLNKPLTPLRVHGFKKKPLGLEARKPQQLLRENTYDVIEPVYHNIRDKDTRKPDKNTDSESESQPKLSPKTRFKKAAIHVAKLSSMPETGKLLCMRERETYTICKEEDKRCKLVHLPLTPEKQLTKLSEIFQSLDTTGRGHHKVKKENSWF